jgi:hypothetical protein
MTKSQARELVGWVSIYVAIASALLAIVIGLAALGERLIEFV